MKPSSESRSTIRLGTSLRTSSDERLARLAATGDRAAFAAIFHRYHQDLYRYCVSILHDRDDAADALQSTMLHALRALEGDDREISLRPWLYRIAHNESVSMLRARKTAPARDELMSAVRDVETSAAVRARLESLLDDMRTLPERQRSALVMRELAGLRYEEIAAALQTSASGAKQAVYDARRTLHELAQARDTSCDAIRRRISDGDRRSARARSIRAHLRACAGCRTFQAQIGVRERELAGITPVMPAAAAAGALKGVLAAAGGGAGAAEGFVVGAGTTAAVNAATVAVTVVIGAGVVGVQIAENREAKPGARAPAATQPATREAPRTVVASTGAHNRRAGGAGGSGRSDARRAGDGDDGRDGSETRDRARERYDESTESGQATTTAPSVVGHRPGRRRGGRLGLGNGRSGENGERGPIRDGVVDVRDTLNDTFDGVRDALPVPTPGLPGPVGRPDR